MIPRSIFLFCTGLAFASEQALLQAPHNPPSSRELLSLHRSLVEIQSITGNEHEVGKWLASYLESKNLTVELQQVDSNRFNVLAYPGETSKTQTLVTSHIDTVPPFWPYRYNHTSNIISGRGSVDAKGSVAAQIIAFLNLLKANLSPSAVSLLFVVGEETGGDGMRYFSSHAPHTYDSVIFGEPTEGKLVCGHKGILSFTIKVQGKAAHSGYPYLGVSANDVVIEALDKLMKLREHLPWSTKYGNTTMNIGRVDGGVAANVVAESAEANIAVRLAAGTPKVLKGMIVDALQGVKTRVEELGGRLEIKWEGEGYPPVDIDCDVNGFDKITVNYGTDIPNLHGTHKRYLYGPGSIFVAHSDHEALKAEELENAVRDYEKLILATFKEQS
ncbi:Zn-dependent exopeptidase [Lepidopterella palustris CBS 459.81]|uniref:Zn-dependent exopeptidase n=1 Tax=Lepidopterella palustris CBS 459.81 TaxID=1314670 RepID=A0A8E2E8K6_9PEZI|nr:Zn-dependent exopeptidase [Lepidopterella palustris CBS 459.81]